MISNVAFIGTGLMGSGMATNIAHAGYSISAWNRTPEKVTQLVEVGVQPARTASEAVIGADIVCCMVTNAEAVEEILFKQGVADAMEKGAIFVSMGSIPPKVEQDHAARLADMGRRHLDAPVSGGTRGAAEGSLAIMVGGDQRAFVDATPVLSAMGRPTWVGPDGSGQLSKLCNQAIVAISVGGLCEAMLLASAGGADPVNVREALRGGFADSRVLQEHGARIMERNWMPGGQIRNIVKDLDAVIDVADDCGLDLPFVSLARELFRGLYDRGITGHDHTALLLQLEHMNRPHRVGDKPDMVPDA
ncbi:MAG: NAD(P)-dependent oxidoreductase [Rhodospirillaceae bacterium]|nr:NAD(P)-dependent oxidoreductase [Rhodospirillaceae bacterium]